MSRHRNVRTMNYEDEYDGYDDVYGHSVEDDYCVSPSTAAQFMYNRDRDASLSNFMGQEEIPEEDEEDGEQTDTSLQDSSSFVRPKLSPEDEARLNSCIEEMTNILGESTPEHILVDAVLANNFEYEKALNQILVQQEAPKAQREPRTKRRNRGAAQSSTPAQPEVAPVKPPEAPPPAPKKAVAASSSSASAQQTSDLPSKVARMTFSSGKQASSGFTPEKKEDAEFNPEAAAIENVKRDLNLNGVEDADILRPAPPSTPQKVASNGDTAAAATPKSTKKQDKINIKKEYEKRKAGGKDFLNLVVIGHVDAGKSTLMGHVLYQLGFVNQRTMHKYEQEAKKIGKASFAYAWVLDETEEERSRGVTMDVAQTRFETTSKVVTLLDAPGHKDFIPNMITGAAQADVAVLVVNSTRGEFETGFEAGGQTREHAMLIRSLGVSQLAVAINKMDTVEWSQERYQEIVKKLGQFLKQAGFRESEVSYIPCSGLGGENLTKVPDEAALAWYKGPSLVDAIDKFKPPERLLERPFRMCVGDVFKGMGSGFCVSGTIQAGSARSGDRVLVMPQGEPATIKGISIDDCQSNIAFAGDNSTLTLTGIDITNIGVGSILCDPSNPIQSTSRIQARVVIFNIDIPITKGFPVVFHYQSMSEPANICKLISQLHKSTGEVVRKKPRCLTKHSSAMIELEINRPVCIELYKDFKDLGRFMMRSGGHTIAAGLVTEIKPSRAAKND